MVNTDNTKTSFAVQCVVIFSIPRTHKLMPFLNSGPQGALIVGAILRPFLAELGALPVSHFVSISTVQQELCEKGTTKNAHITSSFSKLMTQIEWFGNALKNHRDTNGTF
jgi:hypothetical protein